MKSPQSADELLCKYLQDVARALKSLSVERRESELHEMRAHLLEMAARETQNGADEIEALQRAIERFGSPRQNGRALMLAYRGEESWWRFGAAIVASFATVALCYGFLALSFFVWLDAGQEWKRDVWRVCCLFLPWILLGAVAKVIAPRRFSLVLFLSAPVLGFIVLNTSRTVHQWWQSPLLEQALGVLTISIIFVFYWFLANLGGFFTTFLRHKRHRAM